MTPSAETSAAITSTRLDRFAGRAARWFSLFGLMFCALLLASGLHLRYFYTPEAAKAYSDIQSLHTSVAWGLLVRNVHRWSADALLAMLGGLVLAVLPLSMRPASARWVKVCLAGAVLFVALPWLAVLAFSDGVIRGPSVPDRWASGCVRWRSSSVQESRFARISRKSDT